MVSLLFAQKFISRGVFFVEIIARLVASNCELGFTAVGCFTEVSLMEWHGVHGSKVKCIDGICYMRVLGELAGDISAENWRDPNQKSCQNNFIQRLEGENAQPLNSGTADGKYRSALSGTVCALAEFNLHTKDSGCFSLGAFKRLASRF
jgi:hypothetical protein